MAEKNTVQVLIGGKVTRLSGYESKEYLEKVASYLNRKLGELTEMKGWRRMPGDMKSTLLSLNVADDYYKAKSRVEELEEEVQSKDKELYELKQELVNLQLELEAGKKNQNSGYSNNNHRR